MTIFLIIVASASGGVFVGWVAHSLKTATDVIVSDPYEDPSNVTVIRIDRRQP